ncbi:MAG: prolipoprotein diacylglyceryl transferase [Christensenellaceae bacterium]|jgi:phosphatidylglycerol:prolipoprotein diacylglycerol transferase|nr:prolipoprotein diacylglyceryl transferase [Christensenellaceae bacterium]
MFSTLISATDTADMHWTGKIERVAFTIFGREVAWYGIIITLSMFVGLFLATWRSKKAGFKFDDMLELFLFVIPLGVLFARIGYVMVRPEYFTPRPFTWDDFVHIFAIWEGGITITTGVIGGVVGIIIWCLIRKANLLTVLDNTMPTVLGAQAIGRWANFFNQEIYGAAVENPNLQFFPFSVYISNRGGFYQASFFYESMMNLVMLIIVLQVLKRVRLKGSGMLSYFIAYGTVRFIMEFLRDDGSIYDKVEFTQITVGVVALVGIIVFVLLALIETKKGNRVWYPRGVPDDLVIQLTKGGAATIKTTSVATVSPYPPQSSKSTLSDEPKRPRVPFNRSKKKKRHRH